VWEQVTRLMSDPGLIRRELARRLEEHRQNPATASGRSHLQVELSRVAAAIKRLLVAYEADLVSLDELRRRMPDLRKQERNLTTEIESLDGRLTSEEIYLKLAENLEGFLAHLRDGATNTSVRERQRILRLVVREVLVDTDSVVIRHTMPGLDPAGSSTCHLWEYGRRLHPRSARDPQNP